MKKLVIWDLFGGSQNSVYHALKYFKEFEVYTFDNNPNITHDKQYICDLSNLEEFERIVKENNIPHPNAIVASPLCTSFSVLMVSKDVPRGERIAWKFNAEQSMYEPRTIEEIDKIIKETRFFCKSSGKLFFQRAIDGYDILSKTIQIINKYKPWFWYIENPATSLMWDVIDWNFSWIDGFHNTAQYNSYDINLSLKPTTFFSNLKLELKKYNIKNGVRVKKQKNGKNETGERSKIPALLIIDIFTQFSDYLDTMTIVDIDEAHDEKRM